MAASSFKLSKNSYSRCQTLYVLMVCTVKSNALMCPVQSSTRQNGRRQEMKYKHTEEKNWEKRENNSALYRSFSTWLGRPAKSGQVCASWVARRHVGVVSDMFSFVRLCGLVLSLWKAAKATSIQLLKVQFFPFLTFAFRFNNLRARPRSLHFWSVDVTWNVSRLL